MAQIYLQGMAGVPKDVNSAEQLLLTAANAGDADAAFGLSQFYMGQGGKEKQNDESGWTWLNKAADGGNANALDLLGTLYFQGGKVGAKSISKDEKKAVSEFEKLAEAKNPVGLRKMATLFESGVAGVPKDFDKAFEGYKQAAQGNDAFAQFRLGSMYDQGVKDGEGKDAKWKVAPDAATALSLYRLAAQNGLPIAAYNTGVFYEQGRAVDRDLSKAFTYYMAAAQNGINLAMQKVGDFYLNGPAPILKDPVAAAGWYAHSAESGLPEGYLSEGFVVENGLGANKENRYYEAADNYMKAADAPNASDAVRLAAYIRLGGLYYRGLMRSKNDPPSPDYANAYVFFQQAYDVDPKNQVANAARDEVLPHVKDEKAKLDAKIEEMKKDRQARMEKAKAAAADAANAPAAAPAAEAAPAEPAGTKPKKKTK
jgi:TPR repeat protein